MNNNYNDFRLKLIFLALCILILLAIKEHIKLGYASELEQKSIAVAFDYYGFFEDEIETLISRVEEAYMEVRGIKSVDSVSEPGRGYILCMFSEKTNLDEAYVQISDITAHVWAGFPKGVNRPSITKSSSDAYPVYIACFPQEKEFNADYIKKAYEAIPGVGEVHTNGRPKKELMVELHTDRIAGMALSGAGLDSRLRSGNLARKVAMPGGQTLILDSRLASPSDYAQVRVAPDLKLSDVADLNYREAESKNLGHIDGQSVLLFFVMKSGEGNTVRLCRQLDVVTSQFGGSQFFCLGCKIEKSFISSSLILLLLFIFLILGLWFKTRSLHLVAQATCFSIFYLLVAIFAVSMAGFQVDMTVMAALFFVLCFSFEEIIPRKHNYVLKQYNEPINAQDITTLWSIGRKSINDFTSEEIEKSGKWSYKFWQQLGTKSPFFRRWFGDWRENDTSKVEPLLNITPLDFSGPKDAVKYIKNKVKDKTYYRNNKTNIDTDISINIGKLVYDDTLKYAGRKFTRDKDIKHYLALISILPHMEELVEKSILLDTQVIEADEDDNPYRSFMHKFYSITNISGEDYLIKLAVDELNSEGKDYYRTYNVKNIKITPVKGITVYKPTYSTGAGGSTTSISTVADLHALVKKYDKDFHPLPPIRKISYTALFFTSFVILTTLIIALYVPVQFRNPVLPFCIVLTSGLSISAVCQCLMKKGTVPLTWGRIPLWCYSPILLFILFLFLSSSFSPFASDFFFSMEYESGTSFSFIQKSALDIEASLLDWDAFDRLTLHIEQGRAFFTVIGGKKREIMSKISELSSRYPEIFFYIPEKHTRHAIDVTVYGNDVPKIEENILQLAKYVNKSADNVNIIYNFKSDMSKIVLEIPVKCASAGFYPYDVYKTLYYTVSEPVVDKFFAGGVETDVKIRGEDKYRKSLSGLLSIPVISPYGIAGSAGDYITVRREQAQGRIYHKNRMRCLSFSVTGTSRAELNRLVSSFPFTDSCHGEVGL